MKKSQHEKWLARRGLSRVQVAAKKRSLGSPYVLPTYTREPLPRLSDDIPSNGTKSPDMSKANFSKENYAMAPAYNKGPVMVIGKNEIQYAGKK